MRSKKKILILFCGGTLVMEEDAQGTLQSPPADKAISNLLRIEPRLKQIADLTVSYIDNIDSTNINPSHWDRMTDVIAENYHSYDGFVVTHGTDTLAYTSSALSFTLQKMGKPVILTGAQIPGSRIESDARRNLTNAVRVAAMDVSGSIVVFGESIILGCRATKVSESKIDAFDSENRELLGEIRLTVELSSACPIRHDQPLKVKKGFDSNIAVCTIVPGMSVKTLGSLIESGIHGLVLLGYGPGNIPYQYLEAIQKADEMRIPVVVNSQCREGATIMHLYDVGQKALDLGVIQAFDMSIESVATKLMWALNHADDYQIIKKIMHTNLAGEISRPVSNT